MQIQFIGAVKTVTGSMHIVEANGCRVLLECGLFQGRRQESYERNCKFPFDARSIAAMVLSHAHIDHSGNIPNLVRAGFAGNIYATAATADLCRYMLLDSAHIQEQDTAYVNKRRSRNGQPPIEPLYTQADVVRALPAFHAIGYHRPVTIGPGITLQFYDAGHILGSALVVLDIEEEGRTRRLMFSGDPEIVENVQYMMLESTYGNRRHESAEEARQTLRRVVNETYHQNGKLIIPAFAVGRTQDIVYDLHILMMQRKIPALPVFVDSPLATDVTEIYRRHAECYDEDTLALVQQTHKDDAFGFNKLTYIRQIEDSKELNFLREPAIIISASGMCEAGRILHHLKNNIEDPRNTILIAGWQAANTLGRRIVERQPQVQIFGEPYALRARVEIINGYSAHADEAELMDYVRAARGESLQRIFLVHGEEPATLALAGELTTLGGLRVNAPDPLDRVTL